MNGHYASSSILHPVLVDKTEDLLWFSSSAAQRGCWYILLAPAEEVRWSWANIIDRLNDYFIWNGSACCSLDQVKLWSMACSSLIHAPRCCMLANWLVYCSSTPLFEPTGTCPYHVSWHVGGAVLSPANLVAAGLTSTLCCNCDSACSTACSAASQCPPLPLPSVLTWIKMPAWKTFRSLDSQYIFCKGSQWLLTEAVHWEFQHVTASYTMQYCLGFLAG